MAAIQNRHVSQALEYAREVVNGRELACKWVKLACQRQLDDIDHWKRKKDSYLWVPAKGDEICTFAELMPHTKGEWARRGEHIRLRPWQEFIYSTVFGWFRQDGRRRFRTAYSEIPRKNAKSTTSAPVGLYMLGPDNEPGAEVYSAATTRDQARIVFQVAQQMARREPEFREAFGIEVNAHNINRVETGGKFEALSADASTLDGLNVHCGIIDEFHAHKTREVWDVLETATGSRAQSLLWAITTAGSNRAGICYEIRDYVCKLLERVIEDETFFGIIFTIDETDDWTQESSWRKANPNYGYSVYPDDIERKARKAMQVPAAQNNFLTKHLNVWVTADSGLFDMLAWSKAADSTLKLEDMKGCPCWVALDLGFVDDIAAMVILFEREDGYAAFGKYYLPEETIEESRNSQYSGWHRSGRITATDGNITDIEAILDDLEQFLAEYDVREVVYDPYNKLQLLNAAQKRGISPDCMVECPQTVPVMSPATERTMQLVRSQKIKHDGDPVLAWAMSNVVGHFDAKDNVYPRKETAANKIDPAIALIMDVGRATANEGGPSVYETRGVLILGGQA